MGTVVRLEHYTKSFKKVTVLEDINLTLESGKSELRSLIIPLLHQHHNMLSKLHFEDFPWHAY